MLRELKITDVRCILKDYTASPEVLCIGASSRITAYELVRDVEFFSISHLRSKLGYFNPKFSVMREFSQGDPSETKTISLAASLKLNYSSLIVFDEGHVLLYYDMGYDNTVMLLRKGRETYAVDEIENVYSMGRLNLGSLERYDPDVKINMCDISLTYLEYDEDQNVLRVVDIDDYETDTSEDGDPGERSTGSEDLGRSDSGEYKEDSETGNEEQLTGEDEEEDPEDEDEEEEYDEEDDEEEEEEVQLDLEAGSMKGDSETSELDDSEVYTVTYADYENYLAYLWKIKMASKKYTSGDIDKYFKLRHNLFESLVLSYLGLPFKEEEPLSKYGIDSNRTPDFVDIDGSSMLILEFTVVSTLKSAEKGKFDFHKYDREVALLRSEGYDVNIKFIYLALDGSNDLSIDSLESLTPRSHAIRPYEFMRSVYVKFHRYHILSMRFFPEVLTLISDDETFNLDCSIDDGKAWDKSLKSYEEVSEGFPDTDIFLTKFLSLHKMKFIKCLKRLRGHLTYRLVIDVADPSVTSYLDDNGATKEELSVLYETRSALISRHIDISGIDMEDRTCPFQQTENVVIPDRETVVSKSFNFVAVANKVIALPNVRDPLIDQTLSDCAEKVEDVYMLSLEKKMSSLYSYVVYEKNPFMIHPFAACEGALDIDLNHPNKEINAMIRLSNGINFEARKIDRSYSHKDMSRATKELSEAASQVKKSDYRGYQILKRLGDRSLGKANLNVPEELVQRYLKARLKFRDLVKTEARKTGDRKIYSIPISRYKEFWSGQMTHFSKDKGKPKITVIDINDLDQVHVKYLEFYNQIMGATEYEFPGFLNDTVPLAVGTLQLLSGMSEDIRSAYKGFSTSLYFRTLIAYSRIAYSVMYYSMVRGNKNDFFLENCGLSNCLLIVKGGKSIIGTKKSRLFKLFLAIPSNFVNMYRKGSYVVHCSNGIYYLETPWRSFSIKLLKHLNELPYKFSNYYISSYLESGLDHMSYNKFISSKILFSLSNKRKLEVWCSSMRYVYFNSTGTHNAILELIPGMASLDHDELFWLYQRLFAKNYIEIYRSSQSSKIYDIFTGAIFDNYDLCAEKFQEAILMVKADFVGDNEYLRNLRALLDGNVKFDSQLGTLDSPQEVLRDTAVSLADKQYEKNDYTFSPELCFAVGRFFSTLLSQSVTKGELASRFKMIFEKDFSTMGNSRGLRSDDLQFWGSKGFDVIEDYKDLKEKVELLSTGEFENHEEFVRFMSSEDQPFISFYKSQVDRLKYDMASKVQWGDRREVFSQSMVTKALQNPVEKYFSYLCKFCPNEMIHMKSSLRPRFMHRQIFEEEYDKGQTVYATMDCSRWAPEANNWKYYYFVKGMDILPDNFRACFNKLWFLMFNKYVLIKKGYVKKLMSSHDSAKYLKFLKLEGNMTDHHYNKYLTGYTNRQNSRKNKKPEKMLSKEDFEIYSVKRDFDFVMGMYNYLSSLLHAASQLFFSEYISPRYGVITKFYAHSDDSAGRLSSRNKANIYRCFNCYEKFQRLLNHKLSKKKSKLCDLSLEMISIMYYKKRFLPTTHKFLTQISFDPSGLGWSTDVSSVISKVVDVHTNGGTMLQMYCTMLHQGELLRRSYSIQRSQLLSLIPIALGGMYNLHPVHVLMLGAACQETLLDFVESDEARQHRINLYKSVTGTYCPTKPVDLIHKFPIYLRHDKMLDNHDVDFIKALAVMDYPTAIGQSAKYFDSLRNSSFRMALVGNESERVYIQVLFYKSEVIIGDTSLPFRDITNTSLENVLLGFSGRADHPVPKNIYDSYILAVESINFKYTFDLPSSKSCKPISYNTVTLLDLNIDNETFKKITALSISDKAKVAVPNLEKYLYIKDWVKRSLPGSDEDKEEILKKYQRSDYESHRTCYQYMPAGIDVSSASKFVSYSILYSTRRYFISSSDANLFTVEEHSRTPMAQEHLKHLSVLLMALNNMGLVEDVEVKIKRSIEECSHCKDIISEQLLEYIDFYKELVPSIVTELPVATYHTRQRVSPSGWSGQVNFTLYYAGCYIDHCDVLGTSSTLWYVTDPSMLLVCYLIYEIFCKTRDIPMEKPAYLKTHQSYHMLSFVDSGSPKLSELSVFEMALPSSRVVIGEPFLVRISRNTFKEITLGDEPVDFCLYNVRSLSKDFIKKHNLEELRAYIQDTKKLKVEKKKILSAFEFSKITRILSSGPDSEKSEVFLDCEWSGFMGEEGSFSRSLFYCDKSGLTSYRTINKGKLDRRSLENKFLGHLPILDVIPDVNFFRLNLNERRILVKLSRTEKLEAEEMDILYGIRDKLGYAASTKAITLFKFGQEINDVAFYNQVSLTYRFQSFHTLFKCIIDTDFMQASPTAKLYLSISKKRFVYTIFILMRHGDRGLFADLFARGIIFAFLTDKHKFWSYCKEDPMLAIISHGPRKYGFYYGIFETLMAHMMGKVGSLLLSINSPIFHRYKRKFYDCKMPNNTPDDYECEYTVGGIFTTVDEPYTFEDYLLEDVIDGLEEEDKEERVWEGDDILVYVYRMRDLEVAYTSSHQDIASLTILSPINHFMIPWLGIPKKSLKNVDGDVFYCTYYSKSTQKLKFTPLPSRAFRFTLPVLKENVLERSLEEKKKVRYLTDASPIIQDLKEKNELTYNKARDVVFDIIKSAGLDINYNTVDKYLNVMCPGLRGSETLEDFMSSLSTEGLISIFKKMKDYSLKRRSEKSNKDDMLPGFMSHSSDKELLAELKSIFPSCYHYILQGSLVLNKSTRDNLVYDLEAMLLDTELEPGKVTLAVFLKSVIMDSIQGRESNAEFVEVTSEIILEYKRSKKKKRPKLGILSGAGLKDFLSDKRSALKLDYESEDEFYD